MNQYHLAQVNIGRVKAPPDDPLMAGFMTRLDEINALADGSPGFVWRLQTDAGNATYFRPYDDDRILVNMSVWESLESLRHYVYGTMHMELLRRRHEWFEKFSGVYLALWWVPAGHIPGIDEAKKRLAHLEAHGPTEFAFTFKTTFPPDEGFQQSDPGGIATAKPGDPGSWNRYAYVQGDPVNFYDPPGTNAMSPGDYGYCAPEFEDCGEWGWDGGWGGGGGGGGGGFLPVPPNPNPGMARQQWLDYLRKQMALAAAAILASNLQRDAMGPSLAKVPAFLQMTGECWAQGVGSAGTLAYTLEVTYQIEDSTGAAMNSSDLSSIAVSEVFRAVTGGIAPQDNPGTWTTGSRDGIQRNGTFMDYLSAGGIPPLSNPSGSAFQSFNASGFLSNGIPLILQPLTVLGFGPPTTVLNNWYGPNNVTINDYGLGRNPASQCH